MSLNPKRFIRNLVGLLGLSSLSLLVTLQLSAKEVFASQASTRPPSDIPSSRPPTNPVRSKNLFQVLSGDPSFSILTNALTATELMAIVQSGNLTIFAPTDEAFQKLPQDALRELLKPENKEVLTKSLSYHLIQGTSLSSDLRSGSLITLEGQELNIETGMGEIILNQYVKVIRPDIRANNGVIHAIDSVLLPNDL